MPCTKKPMSPTAIRISGPAPTLQFCQCATRPLSQHGFATLASQLSPDSEPVAIDLIVTGDSYYYNHHELVTLPAHRVIANDGASIRYYLDPVSGDILDKIDANDRRYRGLHFGLHRSDFTGFLRFRPV
jgi:hypothetical protein